jgi:hypothetical protein
MDTILKTSRISIFKVFILSVFIFHTVVYANPVVIDPIYTLGSIMVLGSLFFLEAAIITISLLFFGMSPKPLFFAILLGNAAIYFVLFLPIYEAIENLLIAELIIVVVDTGLIKLLAGFALFQWDTFQGVGWIGTGCISVIGNLLSYYVGTIIL